MITLRRLPIKLAVSIKLTTFLVWLSITYRRICAFCLAWCSNSINSGLQSETCYQNDRSCKISFAESNNSNRPASVSENFQWLNNSFLKNYDPCTNPKPKISTVDWKPFRSQMFGKSTYNFSLSSSSKVSSQVLNMYKLWGLAFRQTLPRWIFCRVSR